MSIVVLPACVAPETRMLARAEEIRLEIGFIASDTMTLRIPLPEKIGTYSIKRLIGEGGQALVYEAEQASPRRPVALKVLKGGPFIGRRDLRRFRHEIQALASLRHPLIAAIHEAGQTPEGSPYFAMELVEGVPLNLYFREHALPVRERLALLRRICEAVHYAHQRGVIHRDLKPSNILVDREDTPRVLDFGLARLTHRDAGMSMTESGRLEGTPRYLSPERISGRGDPMDPRADVYSLGVILYEALTGRPPHDVTDLTPDSLRVICEEPPPRPSAFDPTLRGDLEAILLRALEKDPTHRYPSAEALADDIGRFLAGEPIRTRVIPMAVRVRRSVTRHPLRFALPAVLLLLALVGWRWTARQAESRTETKRQMIALYAELLHDPPDPTVVRQATTSASRFPKERDAILVRAQADARTREYRYAIELLRAELTRDPTAWQLRELLIDIYRQTGRTAEAAQESARLPSALPNDAEAWYFRSLATLDLRRGLEYARESVRLGPDADLALRACFGYAMAAKNDTVAVDCAGRLERGDDAARASWIGQRSECLLRLGRYPDAIRALDSLLVITPKDYLRYHYRAVAHRLLRQYPEALLDYTRAVDAADRESNAAWAIYHRGTVNWILGRREEAVSDYRRVFGTLAYATYANARLALCLRDLGRTDDAREALEAARGSLLQNPWLGSVFRCLDGEMTPDELLAAADPSNPCQVCEARYYAGEMALGAGRLDEARRRFRECVATGLRIDPASRIEPMSEHELAEWRLGQLE